MRRQSPQSKASGWPLFLGVLGSVLAAILLAGCGADTPLEASDANAIESTVADPVEPFEDPQLRPGALAETAVATAADSSARSGLARGAAAVDPEAVGTLVAHVTSASITAYEEPDVNSPIVEVFDNPTASGGPLVFQGIDQAGQWLEVLLPIRPNGSTGWVQAENVTLSINPYRLEIDADEYRLSIYRYGEEQFSTTVAIGTGDTPTPIGQFYLIELLRPSNPDGAYGPFAYGLSGYSETLESFNGGNGVIGIHGTNQPEYLGQDVSHGCIRVENDVITAMTEFLPLGTPVIITRDDA